MKRQKLLILIIVTAIFFSCKTITVFDKKIPQKELFHVQDLNTRLVEILNTTDILYDDKGCNIDPIRTIPLNEEFLDIFTVIDLDKYNNGYSYLNSRIPIEYTSPESVIGTRKEIYENYNIIKNKDAKKYFVSLTKYEYSYSEKLNLKFDASVEANIKLLLEELIQDENSNQLAGSISAQILSTVKNELSIEVDTFSYNVNEHLLGLFLLNHKKLVDNNEKNIDNVVSRVDSEKNDNLLTYDKSKQEDIIISNIIMPINLEIYKNDNYRLIQSLLFYRAQENYMEKINNDMKTKIQAILTANNIIDNVEELSTRLSFEVSSKLIKNKLLKAYEESKLLAVGLLKL